MSTKNIKSISTLEKQIETCQDEIKKNQKRINLHYETLTRIYFNLRNILEDERNHEDKLICRPLKREKEKEYKKILRDYKNKKINFQKEDEICNNEIEKNYNLINEYKKEKLTAEDAKEFINTKEFEEKRQENLKKIMGILQDQGEYNAIVNKIQEIMEKK